MILTLSRRVPFWWVTHLAFDQSTPQYDTARYTTDKLNQPIRCVRCQAAVTAQTDAIEIHGQHQHRCTNPSGMMFEVMLYRQARCQHQGTSTSDYTWFAGYAWQMALCAECGLQLGWYYSMGQSPGFYGLIKHLLVYNAS